MPATDALDEFKRYTTDKLRDVRCPQHRQQAKVIFRGGTLQDVNISMVGCCHELMELANKAIGQRRETL